MPRTTQNAGRTTHDMVFCSDWPACLSNRPLLSPSSCSGWGGQCVGVCDDSSWTRCCGLVLESVTRLRITDEKWFIPILSPTRWVTPMYPPLFDMVQPESPRTSQFQASSFPSMPRTKLRHESRTILLHRSKAREMQTSRPHVVSTAQSTPNTQ